MVILFSSQIQENTIKYKQLTLKERYRSNDYQCRGIIIDRVFIDSRPKIVNRKNRIGDFEIDTVIGRHHIGAVGFIAAVARRNKLDFSVFHHIVKHSTIKSNVKNKARVQFFQTILSI